MRLHKQITIVVFLFLLNASVIIAQTTEFTYQGRLLNTSSPASGNYDFEFSLFDAAAAGTQIGSMLPRSMVAVVDGIFNVNLDFGNVFPGANRFLEIRVRQAGVGTYTTLAPRQQINSLPYSVKAVDADNAVNAANATQLGGVAASQYVLTADTRLSDARDPLPESSNYIQNQNAAPQASSNFNIGGTGTANIFSAATHYNIGANKVLSIGTGSNLFAGIDAGASNTSGSENTFIGTGAGWNNTFGIRNTVIGNAANFGLNNLTNATAVGWRAFVSLSNSLVLGSISGVNGATADTKVGIGLTAPSFKMHVSDRSNTGLRVQTDTTGGTVASFGGIGDFQIDSPGIAGGRFIVTENGKVGIGSNNPADKLTVAGTIGSTSGGFKFPDGSIQLSAVGHTYATENRSGCSGTCTDVEIPAFTRPFLSLLHLDLPAGNYVLSATVNFVNDAGFFGQDNRRRIACQLPNMFNRFTIEGGPDYEAMFSIHSVVSLTQPGRLNLECGATSGGTDRSYVWAAQRRFTAVKIDNITNQ